MAMEKTLLTGPQAAARCGYHRATWWRKLMLGLTPAPVRIGKVGHPKWRADELDAWIAAGCPNRRDWEAQHPQAG
jgi:predicted DNA-binding transcriptional regulator AlpA